MTANAAHAPVRRSPLGRLFGVPLVDVADMISAQCEVLRAQWALRAKSPGALVRTAAPAREGRGVTAEEREALTRIAVAVGRVARFGVTRPACLVRAIAMERMIVRRGIHRARVKIGVMRDEDSFKAHAWIEVDGTVVGDSVSHVDRFIPLADFSGLSE